MFTFLQILAMSLTTSEQCLSLLVWSHWSWCSVQAAPLQEELQYLISPHRMQHSPSPPSTRTQHQSQTRALIMSGHYLTYQEVQMKIDVPYVYSTVTKRQEILDLYFYPYCKMSFSRKRLLDFRSNSKDKSLQNDLCQSQETRALSLDQR